jgi:DNA-binding transcriptional MocR family regulator
MSTTRIGPKELASLLQGWRSATGPAYAALAGRLRLLVLDGRLPVGVRLPPEREFAPALGVSRSTISAAYDDLRATSHALSRPGAGTWTSVPASGEQVPAWAPEPAPAGVLDLAHAAPCAPPQLHSAYIAALDELPRYLPGTGYDYRGLKPLRLAIAARFTERGLPTTPSQVLVTNGALQAIRLALSLTVGQGDRVLVEQPSYPNGLDAVRELGGRALPVPVDPATGTWDIGALAAATRHGAPRAAYLIPDFQNPTGALMPDEDRRAVADLLDRSATLAVIDESLVELDLALDTPQARPFAALSLGASVITVGSLSKVGWGGLRVGWLRADSATVARLAAARSRLDLASGVLDQLAGAQLLAQLPDVRDHRVTQLRANRDQLAALVRQRLPQWQARTPRGGLSLWCRLPQPRASELAVTAAGLGLRLSPGSRFAAAALLESWLRLPYTAAADDIDRAVGLLAAAWSQVESGSAVGGSWTPPVAAQPVDNTWIV